MEKIVKMGLMILLVFTLTLAACATGNVNTPLPQTLNIQQPGSDVPKEIADYIGVWERNMEF